MPSPDGPLIVQSDRTVLLEVANPAAESARHELAVFAELERAPEHMHSYRITRLGLWNARAAGHTAEEMLDTLERWSRFPVPDSVRVDLIETAHPDVRTRGIMQVRLDSIGIGAISNPSVSANVLSVTQPISSQLEPHLAALSPPRRSSLEPVSAAGGVRA